ncbi:MAG: trigger factor [Candidatus Caccovivens sp.]
MFNLKKENTKVEIALTIDAKQWEEGVEKVYQASKGKFNVVGFRKGHAPRKVIEKQYGDNVFFEDTVEYFVNETLNEVLQKNPELEPVAMPSTQFESYTVDNGLKMKIFFEIVPDFELCKYKGVSIKVHDTNVTEEEIQHEIHHHLLEDNAKFENVDREIKDGDSVLIDFVGYMNDVAFEGGEGKNYPLEIGSHTFIDTFEEQLIGHKKGEQVEVNVTFPENYGAQEYAGKKALFKVTINEVREKILPELNDKFVADTTEFETVEEYRNHIIAHIQDMKNKNRDNEFEYNMREYLLENTNVEIPEIMVEESVSQDVDRMRKALSAYNVTFEDYLTQTGSNLEDYLKNAKERTLKSIKTRYIYRKLLEENKIEVSKEELASATVGLTDSHDILRKENELLLEKLHTFLKENNTIEVVND